MREKINSPAFLLLVLFLLAGRLADAAPNPILTMVSPAGGSVGQTVEVTIAGSALDDLRGLRCSASGVDFEPIEGSPRRFRASISAETPPGVYDLRAVCRHGLSSPRPFVVGQRRELAEPTGNDDRQSAPLVPLDRVINGQIEKAGDVDYFRIEARRGQRIVIECAADRIDSKLRAALELLDTRGNHLQSGQPFFGLDPLIDFRVPHDGTYVIKIHDLTFTGSKEHIYRLHVDTGPRVAFAWPNVLPEGQSARVTLFGWNLAGTADTTEELTLSSEALAATPPTSSTLDEIEVEIPAAQVCARWPLPISMMPAQTVVEGFSFYLPGSQAPVLIGVTDVAVVTDKSPKGTAETAARVEFPCDISGQLSTGGEHDWYAIEAHHGEVLYLEGFAQRINSSLDLDVRVLDATGEIELARFSDEVRNVGGRSFRTSHLDPVGRWRVPADGSYRILVRDLVGDARADPRRLYRLSIRRETPQFQVAVIPHGDGPAGVNVTRGGRTLLDLVAFRRFGQTGPIRVSARRLPSGVTCPDVVLGPGVNRAPLAVSAEKGASDWVGQLHLEAFAEGVGSQVVRGGVVVRNVEPGSRSRLTQEIPLAVAGNASIQLTANGHEPRDHQLYGKLDVRHSPGGILDVAVQVHRHEGNHHAEVRLRGVGLPGWIEPQVATIQAGSDRGYLSFYLPPGMPVGAYSLAILGDTTIPVAGGKTQAVTTYSNVVTFDVQSPAFQLEVDRFAPRRIRRGEVLKINFSARRLNGFISKIHTELASPGQVTDVVGLRGRGVSFVGQSDTGTIQIIANEDAPLGQLPFLRLYGVGVREDIPLFHGSCWLNLEVVE